MDRATKAKLQRLIDKTAAANDAFHAANTALCNFCLEHYGYEPGDVDADDIIDAIQGGAGGGNSGMTADDFDKAMRR